MLALSCFRSESFSESRDFSPRPHYPSMPKYPKGFALKKPNNDQSSSSSSSSAAATAAAASHLNTALFSVIGMTCSACAGSVEKAIKRLPGIENAAVDVLNNRAQVLFHPNFVNVSAISLSSRDYCTWVFIRICESLRSNAVVYQSVIYGISFLRCFPISCLFLFFV